MNFLKNFLKIILILLALFGVGVSVVFILYLKDNPHQNFLNLISREQSKQNKLEQNIQEEVTKRVVVLEENAVIDVIQASRPAVVSIVAEGVGIDPFKGVYADNQGIGTGFLVKGGFVFTNKHVVSEESTTYSVVLNDGTTTYSVTEINKDPLNDFAILKIDTTDELPFLELGDSNNLKVGQTVIAIGNALGEFSNTASKGIVSGIGRSIVAGGPFGPAELLDDVIQTDAALNPGNSGGPLLDLEGKVIGINVARVVDGDNIGFSIPVNSVKVVFDGFQTTGSIQRPYLGIQYSMNTADTSALNRAPVGAVVTEVLPDTAAQKAGIKRYDVIMQVDGVAINEENSLSSVVALHQVGDEITLSIDRDGKQIDLKVTLQVAE